MDETEESWSSMTKNWRKSATVSEANTLKTISEVLLKSHEKDLTSVSLEVGLLSARRFLPLNGEDFVLTPVPRSQSEYPVENVLSPTHSGNL